jgi:uncharacterized membrane-anchored protein
MGYIQNIEQELKGRLYRLSEDQQKAVIRFVKERILESYRNGIMSAKMVKAGKEAESKTRQFSRGK